MRLVTSNNNDCVAASLSMLLGCSIDSIKNQLFTNLPKPFPGQWAPFPKVPDMNIICDWVWGVYQIALVPFEYNPQSTPHRHCPPESVYPPTTIFQSVTADYAFNNQMSHGPGLIEGQTKGEVGHMCAWDGNVIYDPRGYCYSRNIATEKFGYRVTRFWLAVRGKTL